MIGGQTVRVEWEEANIGDLPLPEKTALQLLVENQGNEWMGMEERQNILEVHGGSENSFDLSWKSQ